MFDLRVMLLFIPVIDFCSGGTDFCIICACVIWREEKKANIEHVRIKNITIDAATVHSFIFFLGSI